MSTRNETSRGPHHPRVSIRLRREFRADAPSMVRAVEALLQRPLPKDDSAPKSGPV